MSLINKLYSPKLLSRIELEFQEFNQPTREQAEYIEQQLFRKLKGKTTLQRSDLKEFIHYALIIEGEREWKKIFQWNNFQAKGESLCTSCGECCRQMKIHLSEEDFQRLIQNNIPPHHFQKIENNRYTFHKQPCPHHNEKTNKCRIYHIRPFSCRNYPLITAKDGSNQPILDRFSGCGYIMNYLTWKIQRMIQEIS